MPDLSLLGNFNVLDSWRPAGWLVVLMFVFTLLITDFFDTMGTMVAVGQEGGLLDEDGHAAADPGDPAGRLDRGGGRRCGQRRPATRRTSRAPPVSAEGARTGVANLVTGALFLLAMFLAPLVAVVPFEAASTALVVVGFLMMTAVRHDRLDRLRDRDPGVPHDRADAVHLLDLQRHRRRA